MNRTWTVSLGRMAWALVLACGMLGAAGPARAGDGVMTRRAVIVGISDYEGTAYDLNYCDDDAIALREALLRDPCWLNANITLLLDAEGTKANIQAALAAMAAAADDDDLCLFYFSGHGGNMPDQAPYDEADGRDEYLCPYHLTTQAILDDELAVWLAAIPTPRVRVIIDSCFSGGMARGAVKSGRVKSVSASGVTAEGDGFAADIRAARMTRDMHTIAGLVCLLACADNEYSYEFSSLGHGVFTYYLVEALGAAATDTDANGEIALEEAHAYLAPRVTAAVAQQHPQLHDGNGDTPADLVGADVLAFVAVTVDDAAENGNDSGAADPGERVRLTITLHNRLAGPLADVSAVLTTDNPAVTVLQAASPYPTLSAGGTAGNTTPFLLGTDLDIPLTASLELTLWVSAAGRLVGLPVPLHIGTRLPLTLFADTLESGASGWTHAAATGTDSWLLATPAQNALAQYASSPTHCWAAAAPGTASDQRLVTPAVALPAGLPCSLEFYHTYQFEMGYDGGIVEISIDGGATYTDLGPHLVEGGYTGGINAAYGNPLGYVSAWTGGTVGPMTRVRADLTPYAGQAVRLRFRLGTDTSISGAGWLLDDLTIGAEEVATEAVAALQVTAPPAGITWRAGESRNIEWLSAGATGETVKLELLHGETVAAVIAETTPNTGLRSWRLPLAQATGSNHRVRVTSLADGACWDATNRPFTVAAAALPAVSLAAAPATPGLVGEQITLTATLAAPATAHYRFFAIVNGVTTTLQAYGAATTCAFTPTEAGSHQFIVWAREPASTANYATFASIYHTVTIPDPPLTAVALAVSPAAPSLVNTTLTLTATPNTTRAVEYRFFAIFYGVTTTLQAYGTTPTCAFTPTAAGNYQFIVWAREVGQNVSYACYKSLVHAVVTEQHPPLTAVALAVSHAAPSAVNTALTLTATPNTTRAVEYRFFTIFNGVTTTLRAYATTPTCAFTPTAAGNYQFIVWAREVGQNVSYACYKSLVHAVTVPGPPLTAVTLAATPAPGTVGAPTLLTATPDTTRAVEYRFFVSVNGGSYVAIRGYQTNPQCAYTPTAAGSHTFLVWAREVGSTRSWDCYKTLPHTVNP